MLGVIIYVYITKILKELVVRCCCCFFNNKQLLQLKLIQLAFSAVKGENYGGDAL